MTKMKEALNTLMAGFEALQAAINEAESTDKAEKPEAEAEQEEQFFVAERMDIGTMEFHDKRCITITLESEEPPVKLFHPMTETCARSVAQSLLALVDKLKEE